MKQSNLDEVLNTPIDETPEGIRLAAVEQEFDASYAELAQSLITELSVVFLNPNFESKIVPGIIDAWFNEPHLKSLHGLKTKFLRWLEDHPPFISRQDPTTINRKSSYMVKVRKDEFLKKKPSAANALLYAMIATDFIDEAIDPNIVEITSPITNARQNLLFHLTDGRNEYTEQDFDHLISEMKKAMSSYLIDFRANVSYFSGVFNDIQSGKSTLQEGVSELIECEAKENLEEMVVFLKDFRDNKTEYSEIEA